MLDMLPYDVTNHYWFVGTDTTQVYSSKSGSYVPVTDLMFLEWMAAGNQPTTISSEESLQQVFSSQYPEGWPIGFQRLRIMAALQESDLVAIRCFKASVAFPSEWNDYVTALRAAYLSEDLVELPSPPKNADGSVAYPAGT